MSSGHIQADRLFSMACQPRNDPETDNRGPPVQMKKQEAASYAQGHTVRRHRAGDEAQTLNTDGDCPEPTDTELRASARGARQGGMQGQRMGPAVCGLIFTIHGREMIRAVFQVKTLMLGDVKGFQVIAKQWQNPGINHYVMPPPGGAESPHPGLLSQGPSSRRDRFSGEAHPSPHRQIHSASASWPQPTATTREAGRVCWRSLWGTLHIATQTARNK